MWSQYDLNPARCQFFLVSSFTIAKASMTVGANQYSAAKIRRSAALKVCLFDQHCCRVVSGVWTTLDFLAPAVCRRSCGMLVCNKNCNICCKALRYFGRKSRRMAADYTADSVGNALKFHGSSMSMSALRWPAASASSVAFM